MPDPALPPGFLIDEAPPPGFTLDQPSQQPMGAGAPDNPQAQAPKAPPAMLAAIRPLKSQEVNPTYTEAGFADEIHPDPVYHTALNDADKKEYAGFFKDPKKPPSAAALQLWYHQKTGALLGNAQDIVDAFKATGKFRTQEKITIPKPNTTTRQAAGHHWVNGVLMDYAPEAGAVFDTLGVGGSGQDRPNVWNSDSSLGSIWANNADLNKSTLDAEMEQHPLASIGGELAGVATDALVGNEAGLANLGKAAKTAAAVAGGAAFGSGAAGPGHRGEGAVTGAALSAATEAGAALLAARAAGKTVARSANQDFAQAAERQGIDYMAADLPKASKSKFMTALSNLTLGGIPLAEQGVKNAATARAAVDRAAANIGSVADKTGAGQAAQRGAKQFVGSTAETLNNLESKIPIASAAPAVVSNTRSALTNLSDSFASNPKLAEAFRDPRVSKFLDALTPQAEPTGVLDAAGKPLTRPQGGGLSWDDLRSFRSRVGEIIGQPGLAADGAQIGQLRALYGALSSDIRQTATEYGPKAEGAWSRWNNYARARSDRIENVVSLILGKDGERGAQSAFEAMQRLSSDKGGDPIKLARALRSMPEEEAGSVRASMLDDLGTASAGKQDHTGTLFSPAEFVTNWNKIGDRAKNVLFTGEHRKAINDIVKVLSGMKASNKFANTSKTGIGVIASTHTIPALIANPIIGAIDMALQYGGGKLLSSPSVARKIAGTPLSEKGAAAYWSRPWVKAMVIKNPAIAGEIMAFQKTILAHANDNVVSAAAASPDPNSEDQQQQTQP